MNKVSVYSDSVLRRHFESGSCYRPSGGGMWRKQYSNIKPPFSKWPSCSNGLRVLKIGRVCIFFFCLNMARKIATDSTLWRFKFLVGIYTSFQVCDSCLFYRFLCFWGSAASRLETVGLKTMGALRKIKKSGERYGTPIQERFSCVYEKDLGRSCISTIGHFIYGDCFWRILETIFWWRCWNSCYLTELPYPNLCSERWPWLR